MAPGVAVPPGVEVPPGTVVSPGTIIPPGWTPEDPAPPGMITPPVVPPSIPGTGPAPPTYVAPWEPGPPRPTGGIVAAPGETEITVYGSSADGYLQSQEATWDLARNNPTGPFVDWWSQYATLTMQGRLQVGSYWVSRAFLYFDLSAIPSGSSIVSAVVTVIGYFNALTEVSIQEGTQGASLTTADFNAYSGAAFSALTWRKVISPNIFPNKFDLNAAGKTYVRSKFGSTAKFCLREYTKDYLNVTPTDAGAGNGMWFQDSTGASRRPRITVIYK